MEFTIEELAKRSMDIQRTIDEIIGSYNSITSLQAAAIWKSDALAIQNVITLFQADLDQFHTREEELLRKEEKTRGNLSFIQRFTASRTSENKHKENLQILHKGIESVATAKSSIYEKINETPSTKAELKTMLNRLISRKRQLAIEKRSVNEEMRQIRATARQAHASLTGLNRGTIGKIATYCEIR